MRNILLVILCVIPLLVYVAKMKNFKLTPQLMVVISVASAMSYVLSLISFIKFPNGGGIQLLSMLPVLMVSILYGRMVGITTGLIYGLLSLISGPYIIKAIGDKKYLESAITIKGGYVDEIKANEKTISYEVQDNIVVPKYSGNITFDSAKKVEEEG